jgi:hypothetical protein
MTSKNSYLANTTDHFQNQNSLTHNFSDNQYLGLYSDEVDGKGYPLYGPFEGPSTIDDPSPNFVGDSALDTVSSTSDITNSVVSTSEAIGSPNLIASFAAEKAGEYINEKQHISDEMGNSPAGHSIASTMQTASDDANRNIRSDLATTSVAVGSMFGPEGLAIGAGIGGAISMINVDSPIDMPTNDGTTISTDNM